MTLWSSDRGQSLQVGAILLFGIVILSLSMYQTVAVPTESERVEFNHNQAVQEDMLELRGVVLGTGADPTLRSATVQLGTTYPSRVLLVNPPPPSGRLATGPQSNVSIENAVATNSETADFLNTAANGRYNLSTRSVSYSPNYNEYDSAPTTTIEMGATINENPRGDETVLTDQSVVQGNEITLVTVTGNLLAARPEAVAVDPKSLSVSTQATTVTNTSGNTLTLTVPTRLSANRWRALLDDEGRVNNVNPVSGQDAVEIELDGGDYRLRTARVGVGSVGSAPEPAYLTRVETRPGDDVTLEVRDRFNNPVPNSRVPDNLTVTSNDTNSLLNDPSVEIDEDGRAAFAFDSKKNSNDAPARLSFTLKNGSGNPISGPQGNVTIVVNKSDLSPAGGVGDGSITNYDENDESSTSEIFSSTNGRWVGITCTDQLLLSGGQPASKPNGNNLQGDVIRLTGRLNDSTGESYTIDIKLARATDNSWNEKEVIIYDRNDNNVNEELTAAAAKRIYEDGETDILELSNYDNPDTGSGSFSDFVQRIQALEDDAPVVWQTSRMTGRVTVALECDPPPEPPASGVSVVDGTTPSTESSALEFDIQVASGLTKTITDVNITTPGNQNDNVESSWELKRSSQKQVRLTVSNTNGVNQSGGLDRNIKFDGTNYGLDTNAVFSDGAVLDVDMGEIQDGNVKLNYNLVDSRNEADVVVTFYFQDGTQFQVYLRVTNVNS